MIEQPRTSKKSRPVVAGSDAPGIEDRKLPSAFPRSATRSPTFKFDTLRVAELIEACRARVANLTELTGVIARTLYELYDYQSDDPELWQCCRLVRQVLKQAQLAFIPLGIVSHDTAPRDRAAEIAKGCEAQRHWLRPAIHVIRATIYVLIDVKLDHHDEILPALRDVESGLSSVVVGLEHVIQCCPHRTGRRAAR